MAEVDPPKDGQQEAKWKRFEKLVYEIQNSFAGTTATVTHKDYVMGQASKVEREIDVSIKQKIAQFAGWRIRRDALCRDVRDPGFAVPSHLSPLTQIVLGAVLSELLQA